MSHRRSENNKKLQEYTLEHGEMTGNLNEHDEKYAAITKERTEKEHKIKEEIA